LIISLTGTREVLYMVNRSGNAPSHLDSAKWLDKTLDLVSDSFEKIYIRGDTDFSLTSNFDKWDWRILNGSTSWKLSFRKSALFQVKMVLPKRLTSSTPHCNPG